MYRFDLNEGPPTAQELAAALAEHKRHRRRLMKFACISDVAHLLILLVFYFGDFLSGGAVLVLFALSLVVALVLATASRDRLQFTDLVAIAATIGGTAGATTLLLGAGMDQPWPASIAAGLTAGSITLSGTLLGRLLKRVMAAIEQMKPIPLDDAALVELGFLCRQDDRLRQYRDQAVQNLRPHLTFGELDAMRDYYRQGQRRTVNGEQR